MVTGLAWVTVKSKVHKKTIINLGLSILYAARHIYVASKYLVYGFWSNKLLVCSSNIRTTVGLKLVVLYSGCDIMDMVTVCI